MQGNWIAAAQWHVMPDFPAEIVERQCPDGGLEKLPGILYFRRCAAVSANMRPGLLGLKIHFLLKNADICYQTVNLHVQHIYRRYAAWKECWKEESYELVL